ncbi:xanthine dehydrogenase accessory protein XdhC [Sinorhizobium sp. BG8]|uniref:xanthine dehydrogenase accessory protein XdhC n=1 Tax=Sinorhizobium sp. BG8 TaxID=2613773 RepID=UPI00193C9A7A|nr:xanthine dehydrogenase accessory protein XdhC [Sinorhizobium sp. BG8]QRM56364.1 xanthine dehydrogenase accessory protein XdhC [Sinorhizobium sp. BG8]
MNYLQDSLDAFLAREYRLVIVEIAEVRGSTPRDEDAFMLVAPTDVYGTIGGGRLEFIAIENARKLLAEAGGEKSLDVPLGPDIGQCCGGRVALRFTIGDDEARSALLRKLKAREQAEPQVWLFGAGHVGRALSDALILLPLQVFVVETRQVELDLLTFEVHGRLAAMPEAMVSDIPAGSAVVIITHDHALDFLIAREALARTDLAYVGMIGSKTKRASFASWLEQEGAERSMAEGLVLPIGGKAVHDKRPEVIAAMTAAEILTAISTYRASERS